MLVFIQNSPRAYAWGSTEALPAVLRQEPTGEPQAELWLGDHAGGPAQVSRGGSQPITLIDLINEDPNAYGVDGGQLPFLLKVLGIGSPLSIQVHPARDAAVAGFAREEAAGVPLDAPERNYRDRNHKPELLVALTPVRALSGFRPVEQVHDDLSLIVRHAGTCGAQGSQALFSLYATLSQAMREGEREARNAVLDWTYSGRSFVTDAAHALGMLAQEHRVPGLAPVRREVLGLIAQSYPGDPGIFVSLLMNIAELAPGEAIFLNAGQLHAYLSGVGVEVMASSDNVIRAGLTPKHIDVAELRHILDLSTLERPIFQATTVQGGLTTWQPPVSDFVLHRVRVGLPDEEHVVVGDERSASIILEAAYPTVMISTNGTLRIERTGEESSEVANVRQGQSLYISAGEPIEITGDGEAFLASVGENWACRNLQVGV